MSRDAVGFCSSLEMFSSEAKNGCCGFTKRTWDMIGRGTFGKLAALAVVGVVGLAGAASFADSYAYVGTVVLNLGPFQSQYGGEFSAKLTYEPSPPVLVKDQNSPTYVDYYGLGAAAGGNNTPDPHVTPTVAVFETFCIEEGLHDVVFNPGTYYAATIGTTDGLPQTINARTAYLFDKFWNGTLSNYFSGGSGLTRKQSAGALQAAIWYLEGDQLTIGATYSDAGIAGNSALAIAEQHQADLWVTEAQNWVNANPTASLVPPVQVLGMFSNYDSRYGTLSGLAQAQLVEINSPGGAGLRPVPLPAAVGVGFSMLGGFGLLAGVRKRVRRQPRIAV